MLVSVAAREILKYDIISPIGSSRRRTHVHEPAHYENDSRMKLFPRDQSSSSVSDAHGKLGANHTFID